MVMGKLHPTGALMQWQNVEGGRGGIQGLVRTVPRTQEDPPLTFLKISRWNLKESKLRILHFCKQIDSNPINNYLEASKLRVLLELSQYLEKPHSDQVIILGSMGADLEPFFFSCLFYVPLIKC